ncbi:hypothetical protein PFISCL1PPCAC_18679, partial [Pristionchus fissidentatus]
QSGIQLEVERYLKHDAHARENSDYMAGLAKEDYCTNKSITWDDLLNREYSINYVWNPIHGKVNGTVYEIACIDEWHNASTYTRFLRDNFIYGNLRIRPDSIRYLQNRESVGYAFWFELIEFYFHEFHEPLSPAFDQLSRFVLDVDEFQARLSEKTKWRKSDFEMARQFVRDHPREAASISSDLARKFEKEFIFLKRGEAIG